MAFSKDKQLLFSRLAILAGHIGWIAFLVSGMKGFPHWYAGFAPFFWFAFGLGNLPKRTSFWLLLNHRLPFGVFYAALALSLFLTDQFGLSRGLWFHQLYAGVWFPAVYGVLLPLTALALLELFYTLSGAAGRHLTFRSVRNTKGHQTLDICESVLFLAMVGVIVSGAVSGFPLLLPLAFFLAVPWMAAATVKFYFHVEHAEHYSIILITIVLLAALIYAHPGMIMFVWTCFAPPALNALLIGVPLFAWLGWYWLVLFTLRLWIFLVLHPRVR